MVMVLQHVCPDRVVLPLVRVWLDCLVLGAAWLPLVLFPLHGSVAARFPSVNCRCAELALAPCNAAQRSVGRAARCRGSLPLRVPCRPAAAPAAALRCLRPALGHGPRAGPIGATHAGNAAARRAAASRSAHGAQGAARRALQLSRLQPVCLPLFLCRFPLPSCCALYCALSAHYS